MSEPTVDRAAAERVHYTDPRVRQLAFARWHLTTGGSHREWLALGKDHPYALIAEARDWLCAAVAAGIVPPAGAEAHPPRSLWFVETHDPLADAWAGSVPHFDSGAAHARRRTLDETPPTWRHDGSRVQRRVVRETTTFTEEPTP